MQDDKEACANFAQGANTSCMAAPKYTTAAVVLNHDDNENTLRLAADFDRFPSVDLTVVVDNSGTGGLTAIGGKKTVLLSVPNNGYSVGNNAGVKKTDQMGGAEFIIISNPDVFVGDDAIAACVAFLRAHPDYALAAPRMHAADGTPHHLAAWRERTFLCDLAYSAGILSRIVGMRRECYPEEYLKQPAVDVDCVAGSFFVIRRTALSCTGSFDEHTFLYYEEDILGFKLKRLGLRSALLGERRFVHCEGASVNRSMNYLKKYLAMQKSRLYFHRRYKKTAFPAFAALCLATALGTVEKTIKTVYYRAKKD